MKAESLPCVVDKIKKCNSITMTLVFVVLLVLFSIYQIKVSSIYELHKAISSPRSDRGTTFSTSLDLALATPIICNRSHPSYDICSIRSPTVLDPNLFTFYVRTRTDSTPMVEKIQPYPRKWDPYRMYHIKEISLISGPSTPPCTVQHNSSAMVFSVAGYDGDIFTDFYDEFIPLFITLDLIFSSRDNVLVISNVHDWWMWKYGDFVQKFTKYPIINLHNDTNTHCFPSATIGLISIDRMSINPKEPSVSKTVLHFHALLEETYGTIRNPITTTLKSRPKLVLAGRKGSIGRLILNEDEVKKIAEEEGYEVIKFNPRYTTSMHEAYELMSSSHAFIGVHGAALTHFLLLRPGSVFMQVVPLGTHLLSEKCFGILAREMQLEYMEYNIELRESSLVEKYGKDNMMIKDPDGFLKKKGWSSETVEIYLKKQNVRLNLVRFREELKKAYVKSKAFMEREG